MKTPAIVLAIVFAYSSVGQAQTCPTPAQLATDLNAAAQADVISLAGINPLNCPEVTMAETWTGGKYLFSDSPESPTTNGKLYYDNGMAATSGTVYNRIFVYHVNNSGATKRFTVVIKNTGSTSGTLTVQKKGTAGPSTSFLYTGKLGFQRWLSSTAGSGIAVSKNTWVRLDTTFDTTNVTSGNLLHGIWDYSFTQPHEIAICMLSTGDTPTTACPAASVLSRDASHQRGTFPYADKIYDTGSGVTINTTGDIQQFPMAGGTTNDSNAVGTDDTDGSSQTLSGNYGILYRMHLSTASGDGRNLGFLINPRAGGWGSAVNAMAGILAGGVFLIPAGSGSSSDNTKGSTEGKYTPGAGLTPWMQAMPTGGSAFPVRIVATPY